jgi:hypothetical protein
MGATLLTPLSYSGPCLLLVGEVNSYICVCMCVYDYMCRCVKARHLHTCIYIYMIIIYTCIYLGMHASVMDIRKGVLADMDEDLSGDVTFDEFLQSYWSRSTWDKLYEVRIIIDIV